MGAPRRGREGVEVMGKGVRRRGGSGVVGGGGGGGGGGVGGGGGGGLACTGGGPQAGLRPGPSFTQLSHDLLGAGGQSQGTGWGGDLGFQDVKGVGDDRIGWG